MFTPRFEKEVEVRHPVIVHSGCGRHTFLQGKIGRLAYYIEQEGYLVKVLHDGDIYELILRPINFSLTEETPNEEEPSTTFTF